MDIHTHTLPAPTTLDTAPPRARDRRLTRLRRSVLAHRIVFFTVLLCAWELVSRVGPWPDYLMPGQNGVDLARQITEARREFPMIICSGHSFGLTRERAAELGFREFLQKPVEFDSLRQAVRAALPHPA